MILQLFIRPAPGIALGHFDLFFALIYQNIHIVLDEPRDFWGARPGGLHRFDSLCNPSRGVRRADSEPSVCVIHRIQISCSVLKPEATGPPRFIAGSAHQRRSPVLPVIFFVSGEKSFDERIADFWL
jgi:hypothetical protein